MLDDDDVTIIQTEEDKEKLVKKLLGDQYDLDTEDDTTIVNNSDQS